MTDAETEVLTRVMLDSGEVLDMSRVDGPKVDKHSTGGVGDKLSLICAPVAAAVGVRVPMISGRGLGHTGGTLDKLESIPGMRTDFPPERFIELVADVGMAIVGQSPELAPADRKMYALRDVTATVECCAPDRGQHPVEEARRRAGRPCARRQGRARGLHGRHRAGPDAGLGAGQRRRAGWDFPRPRS